MACCLFLIPASLLLNLNQGGSMLNRLFIATSNSLIKLNVNTSYI